MNKTIPKENIFWGIAGILFGLVVFCFFIYFLMRNELIHYNSNNFFYRYWEVIFFLNASLTFIIAGFLNLKGFIRPYNSKHSDAYEKAKVNVLFTTIGTPAIFILIFMSMKTINNSGIKILGTVVLLFIAFRFIADMKIIKGRNTIK